MGTNYYRIPTEQEMEERKAILVKRIKELELTPANIERRFSTIQTHDSDYIWEHESPWDEFTNDTKIHLGKRSGGWKFCWNFHKDKYYTNKEELLAFIRRGRVVDEYGTEWNPEEFIKMALEWGGETGWVLDAKYEAEQRKNGGHTWGPKYYDLDIDGLRVSTSTDFC